MNSPSGFTCMCTEGVRGSRCEETIRCSPDSCENGGTCRELKSGNVTCACPQGYSGPHCQHSHNRCATAPRPCHNGATCHNRLEGEGYTCSCPKGYTGPHCNIRDHCSSSPCRSGESCRVIANGFQCGCPPGGVCLGGDVLASNVSHRISSREDMEKGLDVLEVVLICVLSATLVVIVLLVFCVTRCVLLRRKRREEVPHSNKEVECDVERMQNERNLLHMNNKGCGESVPGKIVNELDTAKHANDASLLPTPFPPKVLNMEAGGKKRAMTTEKGGTPPLRAFQKIDNTSGGSIR